MRAINVLEGTYPNELIDEEEFAKHIKLLTSNLELRNSAGKAARKYIELNYSWSASVKIIFEEYKKLLNT